MTNEELSAIVASNARAIQALGEKLDQGFGNAFEAINQQNELMSELRQSQQANVQMVEVLIGESRENNRQHQDFRQRIEAISETLRSLLGQVLARLNDIWERSAS